MISDGMSLRKAIHGKMSNEKFYSIADSSEELAKRYARACEYRADKMFEEILEIADDANNDTQEIDIEGEKHSKLNREVIERAKIKIDARKWMLGKMQPKKYSDKLDLTTDGKEINQHQVINVSGLTDEQLDKLTR